MSAVSVFRVIRVVRRVEGAAKGRQPSGMESMAFLRALGVHPYLAAALAGILAFQIAEPYVGYLLGQLGPSPFITPASLGMSAADYQHQWLLQRIYGRQEGDNLFKQMVSHRQTEIDLRGKLP